MAVDFGIGAYAAGGSIMIKREAYMGRIRPFIGGDLIKAITGMRRSGKSVMLRLIQEEILGAGVPAGRILEVNFEEMRNERLLTAQALHDYVTEWARDAEGKVFLFFDEIQDVAEWERCVRSLRVSIDCDIYITGSNARLLFGELAASLGGRYVEFSIYPFSFSEFMDLCRARGPVGGERECFSLYLQLGGMPYLSNLRYEREASIQYLRDLFNSIVLKDVVQKNKVRDVDLLERILSFAMAGVGNVFSASSVAKYLKQERRPASPETILNYLKYCCDAYLLYQVKREDLRGKQILSSREKYYVADHGIREAVYGGNERDINQILENIVYMELLRRGYAVTVGQNGEREVVFSCARRGERLYVQVAYLLASGETVEREFGAYDGISDNYPKYVVTMDEIDFSRDGIKHRNIRDFLTAGEWA